MIDQAKNMVIGVFILTALTIVVFILLFLNPSVGDKEQVLHVRFTDIDKVNPGTKVTFAGKQVGEVINIKDIEDGRGGRQDDMGHVYVYELTIALDSGIEVYETDEISLRTSGLLGERSVGITPIGRKPGESLRRVNQDEILYAIDAGSVEETMKEFKEVANKFDVALDNISAAFEDLRKEQVIHHIALATKNISDITGALNRPTDWSETLKNVHSASSELATRLPESWNTVDETLGDFKSASANVRDVSVRFQQGEGTLGRLLSRDDLYLDIKAILSKAETVADDINHYGLTFNQDKGWQRLRARRMNLLAKLSTPQEFHNYFNDEMSEITTSLARVSSVLDATFCWDYCNNGVLIEDPCFSAAFSDLLRRVGAMQEALESYNEQIVDCYP